MLLDDEKLKRLDELLAVPAAVATLRQMLSAAHTPEVRVAAAKALIDLWMMDDEEKQNRLIQHGLDIVATDERAESEQSAEELINQVLVNDDEDLDLTGNESHETSAATRDTAKSPFAGAQARVAPAKAAPAVPAKTAPMSPPPVSARNGVQAKPAAAAPVNKTKPKQADDEEARPKVPVKYWVVLGALALVLSFTWLIGWATAPESAASLANRALSAGSPEERAKAAAELASHSKESLPYMRRVAKESKDAPVLTAIFNGLTVHGDTESAELFLAGMANKDSMVRDLAFKGLARAMNIPFDKREEFKANDPEDTRAQVISRLRKQYAPGSQ